MLKNDRVAAWLAFASVSFFWGTTYLAIKIGVGSFPPILFAGIRHLIAGIILLIYFWLRGYKLPKGPELKRSFMSGILMLVLGNGVVVWSQQWVSSGLTAIVCSTIPIFVFLFTWMSNKEDKINLTIIIGILLGVGGQIIIFYNKLSDFTNPQYRVGLLMLIIPLLSWGYGTVYQRKTKYEGGSPLYLAGWQMAFAGLILCFAGMAKGEQLSGEISADALWAMLYLIIIGSIVAYGCFMFALTKLPATIVSMYSHINTIVAVFLGWLILDEALSDNILISGVVTLVGMYLVTVGIRKKKT